MVALSFSPSAIHSRSISTGAMKLLLLLLTLASVVAGQLSPGGNLYRLALDLLHGLPSQYEGRIPLYDDDNIDNNLYIPQYRTDINDYDEVAEEVPELPQNKLFKLSVMPLLQEAGDLNHTEALVALGDIYMFGNYSTPTNYTKALNYYHRAVAIEPHGHGYFMLGFLYSTGAFGEIAIDEQRANLYYQFGVENNDVDSILVVAYNFFNGIGRPTDCKMARYYYSRLAHIGMKFINENNYIEDDHELEYNIKLVDFNGGIYGPKLSESPSSVTKKTMSLTKNNFNEFFIDIHDHGYVDCYFTALENYYGNYFIPEDHNEAFKVIHECVDIAQTRYGAKNYFHINKIDRFFISRCQTLLATMYLRGHGTKQNYEQAFKWFTSAIKLHSDASDAYNSLADIFQRGPLTSGAISSNATEYYLKALKAGSSKAALSVALAALNNADFKQAVISNDNDIFQLIENAALSGNTQSLYHWLNFIDSGRVRGQVSSCESIVPYYRLFIEKLEKFYFPHLRYAFDEFKYGNFKNSLLGYLIAAEQGLENAQVSSAYFLFQLEPFLSLKPKKTFSQNRMNSAIKYLEKASAQKNIDATILLGDIYFKGIESANVSVDYNKAFAYYNRAAQGYSSHGSFNLGYMYEYGLGPVNNSVDYFLAKRYYDLSLERKVSTDMMKTGSYKTNVVPINLALLRLRLKFLFNRKKFSSQENSREGYGWLKSFKKLGDKKEAEVTNENQNTPKNTASTANKKQAKARSQHEGSSFFVDEEYDTGDYLVMFLTFMFFVIFLVQNIYRHVRRLGQRRNGNRNEEEDNAAAAAAAAEDAPNRGVNFEFHFVAL